MKREKIKCQCGDEVFTDEWHDCDPAPPPSLAEKIERLKPKRGGATMIIIEADGSVMIRQMLGAEVYLSPFHTLKVFGDTLEQAVDAALADLLADEKAIAAMEEGR